MVEATKTVSEIEKDAESAKRPSGTKIELNITKPKPLDAQPKPLINPSNEVFSNTPDAGLDPIDRGEAPLSEKITDSVGILDEPDMVVTDSAGVFDFEGEDHDQMDIMVQGTPVRIKKVEPETDYAKALKYGFANSALGLAINGEIPKPMELQFGEEVVSSLGAVVGDLPTFLTGFFVGGGPLSLVTGMGGGFAATEGIKQVLRDSIEKGEINTAGEWWERFKGATEEAGKGYAIGAVTGGAGKAVKTATEMAEASLLAKQAAPFLAEVSAMTTTSAAIEGREPTAREFAVAAVALGAMKGAAKGAGELASTVKKLKEIYAETKTRPELVTLEDLLDNGQRLGRAKEQGFAEGVYYHGTTADIQGFAPEAMGGNTGAPSAKKGFFFSSSSKVAIGYSKIAKSRKEGNLAREIKSIEKTIVDEGGMSSSDLHFAIDKTTGMGFVERNRHFESDPVLSKHKRELHRIHTLEEEIQEIVDARVKASSRFKAEEDEAQMDYHNHIKDIGDEGAFERLELGTDVDASHFRKSDPPHGYRLDAILNELIAPDLYPERQYLHDVLDPMKVLSEDQLYLKLVKHKLKESPRKQEHLDRLDELYQNIENSKQQGDSLYKFEETVYPVKLRTSNPLVKDFGGKGYRDETYSDLIDQARAEGNDSLILKDTYDPGKMNFNEKTDIVVVFEPNQIRSAYDSFLPENSESSQLIHEPPTTKAAERYIAFLSNERGGVEFGRGDFEALKKDIESRGIELDLFEDDARITLSKIVIPKKSRGQGIGSDVLAKIKEYADSTGKDIVLTPSKTFGATSVKRLEAFYKRQGFKENKGRNTDFGTRERFIYKPNPLLNERGGGEFFRDEPLEGKEEFSQEAADVKRVNDMYRRAEAKKKETLGEQAAKVKRHFNRLFIDRTVNFKDEMKAVFGEEDAAPLIQRYVLSSGWHPNAKLILDRAKSKIDKGLSRDEMLELDKIIASRRTIEIDLNKAAERARVQDAISEAKQTHDLIRKGINDSLNAKIKPHDDRIQKLIEIRLRLEKEQEGKEKRTREEISKLSKVKKGIEEAGKAIRKLEKEAGKELKERSGPIEAVIKNLSTRYNNIGNMQHPEGLTMKEHQAYLDSIPSKTRAKLFPRADEYANVMREQLIELHKEGLLTDQAYQAIAKKGEFYSLRQYLEAIDPEEEISLRGQSKKVMGSGLHRLDEGSLELMENDHTLLLEEVVGRTQRRVFANRAAQELHKLAIKSSDPSQEILSTILKVAEEGEEIPPGYAELHAMVNGERKTIWMREDLAKEYIDEPLINRQNVLRVLEWLTLARPLKISATGWNPEFFITNLPRDMMLMWGATNQYSSIGPIAMAQMVKDMITVAPDLAFKKGRYEKAAQDGMLQDLLTTQGKPINIKGPWKAIAEAVAWPGEFTETLTRMAVRERAIKNGMTPEEAAFEARNVLDYQQSGHAAQVAEVGSPYIKAAIAGTRAVVRYAKEDFGMFLFKMAQLGSFSVGLYYYNTVLSGMPEAYDAIPTTDKAKFFNILVPSMAQTDENGNVRVPYIRIAKDQGQQIFTPLFDSMMALKLNRDFDYEQLVEAFHGGLPVTEQSAFGPMAGMVSSLYNYSLFFRDNIWKKQPVELWAEYDSRTNPLAYKLGQMTSYVDDVTGERKSIPFIGVSPKRLEVAVGSVIAQSHPLAPMVGETMRAVMDEVPDAKKREIYEKWNSIPGLRRLVKWTKPYNPQALKDIQKAKVSENTEKKITDDELKALFKGRDMSDTERNKNITEFIKEKIAKKKGPGKLKEMNRLKGNVLFMKKMEKIGGVPNKAFWYELRGLTDPETKADAYYGVWRKQTPEMQKRYDELLPRLNITSQKDFVVFYSKLKQLKKEKPK